MGIATGEKIASSPYLHTGALPFGTTSFGQGLDLTFIGQASCGGSEENLFECAEDVFEERETCAPETYVGVRCEGMTLKSFLITEHELVIGV